MNDLLLRGTRIWSGGIADIAIRDGRIAAIGAAASTVGAEEIVDATGTIALPGLVDGHAHLDKTLWGTPWHSHRAGPTVLERIDNERRVLRALGLSPARQSAQLLRHMIARGTTHVRTHVDVGPETRLTHVHGVMETRDAHRDWIDMQIVAFPQAGVLRQPGTIELLDHAVRDGAELVGDSIQQESTETQRASWMPCLQSRPGAAAGSTSIFMSVASKARRRSR